ncbi:MAG: hypothetical protein JST30_11075 [Armatimonadetes bacterium]|nr:hypothetical protein [Armatimonadota bacterium]
MNEFYDKLVDLYAGGDLPEELDEHLQRAAMGDPALAQDMVTLKFTVDSLRQMPAPVLTEESDYRILLKLQLQGADAQRRSPSPGYWQYHLPIQS